MKVDYELRAALLRAGATERARYETVAPAPRKPQHRINPPPQANLWRIAQKIMTEVGNCIPDCDPIDNLAPFIERLGLNRWDTTKWLDKACRKHLNAKSYSQYLIDAWDGWNEVCEPDQRMANPWRSTN